MVTTVGSVISLTSGGNPSTTSLSTLSRSSKYFTMRITQVFNLRKPLLAFPKETWLSLLAEMSQRGEGRRESGAYLLYDDLDPDCLVGAIDFGSIGYHRLNKQCRERGLRVIADVHSHPGGATQQSYVDQRHPMVSREGHLALIVPNFAQGHIRKHQVGLHRFHSSGEWDEWSGVDSAKRIRISWW